MLVFIGGAHRGPERKEMNMFEIARNSTGLVEGRQPVPTENEARAIAAALVAQTGEAYQLWDATRMVDVICAD